MPPHTTHLIVVVEVVAIALIVIYATVVVWYCNYSLVKVDDLKLCSRV